MVNFIVALKPTVLQTPLYRMRAVQDLCQDLCYCYSYNLDSCACRFPWLKPLRLLYFVPAILSISAQKRSYNLL